MSLDKHKHALVFISAGVGDAILLVPLVNELKKQGYKVTGLFTSPYNCESIFENTKVFDNIKVRKNKLALFVYALLRFRFFDKVFVNHFSFSKTNIGLAALLGRNVYTNYKEMTAAQSSKAIHIIEPIANTHDALQNIFLHNQQLTLSDLNFNLHYKALNTNKFKLSADYIILQISSANNKAPYKNWDSEKWFELFEYLQIELPQAQLVILGDQTELHLNTKINQLGNKNIISLIGQTQLSDVMEIIQHSKFYIGLDSGLMHMAFALNKPTFTIWGASNPVLYGYDWVGKTHHIVSLNLACAPCSAWINPNTSRVSNPLQCPDFKCIKDILVTKVKAELSDFIKSLNSFRH